MIKRPSSTDLSLVSASFGIALGLLMIALLGVFVLPYLIPLGGPDQIPLTELVDPNGVFVDVSGEQIYVTHTAGDGAAVVLIHGFGGSTVTWVDTAPVLAAAGYDVYAIDLLGFGLSEKGWNHDYSHAAQAKRVIGVMDALGIERAVVVGHSMGGNVAAHLTLNHSERVSQLVLVSASILSDQDSGNGMLPIPVELLDLPVARRWGQLLIRELVPPAFEDMLFDAAYQDGMISASIAEGYRRSLYTSGWDLGLMGITRDGTGNDVPLPVTDLAVPTLLLWGAQDTWVPVQQGEALQELIPGAEYVEFADVGHLPMHEVPAEFNTVLLDFLGGE